MQNPNTIQDTMPAAEIAALQFQQLQQLVADLGSRSPYYKAMFQRNGIEAALLHTMAGFIQIPTTHKADLAAGNRDFYAVPDEAIADYCTTSGTTGNAVTIPLTEADLQRLAVNEAGSFAIAGVTRADTVMLMLTMDRMFMAGMAYYLGLRKMGAAVIRSGAVSPHAQWEQITRFQPTVLVAVPSFVVKMLEYARLNRIAYLGSGVHTIICIGEPIRNADLSLNTLGETITGQWPVKLISTYASSEMQTAFTECGAGGNHLQPGLIFAELLDDNDQPVAAGQPGEVTISTFGIEGLPLLRYRTGDICTQITAPCSCGRNTMRLSPIIGRKNQMIKLKGTTIFPPAIEDALHLVSGIADYIIEVARDEFNLDRVTIHILPAGDGSTIEAALKAALQSKLRVIPDINFVDAGSLAKMRNADSRKPVRVVFR